MRLLLGALRGVVTTTPALPARKRQCGGARNPLAAGHREKG